MTESLLQFIWRLQHYNKGELATEQGDRLQIIHPGIHNSNQGPDFLEARIMLDHFLCVGSIELHIKTSDWLRHAHQTDRNYANIILHVVWQHDLPPDNFLGFPTLELQPRVSLLLLNRYKMLMSQGSFVACEKYLNNISSLLWRNWMDRMAMERLHTKGLKIAEMLKGNQFNWEETLWWMLATHFGSKVNAAAFNAVAKSLPLKLLARHKKQILQLEALLLGQAGLLNDNFKEDYPLMLQREYRFLQKKYSLVPVRIPVLFLRMRPAGFPSVRLAQLASLLHQSSHLFSAIKEVNSLAELMDLLKPTANDYWHYHYRFDEPSGYSPKVMGKQMLNSLLINAIIPVLHYYGLYHKNEALLNKALRWMHEMNAEKNNIVAGWEKLKIKAENAFDSQALLQLKLTYCNNYRCLDCAIGNTVIKGVGISGSDASTLQTRNLPGETN